MVVLIILIILIAYALGCIQTPSLVCAALFKQDKQTAAEIRTYPQVHRSCGWAGVGAVFAADLIRAAVILLVGGLLLKGAGFPGVGRRLALLFALLAQLLPVTDYVRGRQRLVFPALLLLFADWRLFLIALVLFLIVYLLTKRISLCALAAALSYPVFSIILGAWWMQVILALAAAVVMILPYRGNLIKFFSGLRKGKKQGEEEL